MTMAMNEYDVEVAKYHHETVKFIQEQRTARTSLVVKGCLTGLAIVAFTAIELSTPTWLTVMMWVGGTLLGSSGLIASVIKAYYRYVRKVGRRTAALEKQLDKNRTSSDSFNSPMLGETSEDE